jgi:hypothetical protein
MSDQPLDLYAILREEYVRLHGAPPPDETGSDEEKLKKLYAAIHALETPRAALCISGGGIRSATFALGVIQRLATVGVLPKFDFVSTVSGGGYIGGWLSSYARRNADGMSGVAEELRSDGVNGNPLEPEVKPLTWLRMFSNYLTPKLGLTSGDTWAFTGSYLRNLLLVWLMFVPLLISALAIPRLAIALLREQPESSTYVVVAAVLLFIGMLVLALTRPVSYKNAGWLTNGRFILGVFVPLFLGSISLALYWASLADRTFNWEVVFFAMISISAFSSVVYMTRYIFATHSERMGNVKLASSRTAYMAKKFVHELLAAAASGAAVTGLLFAATHLFGDPKASVVLPQLSSWQSIPPDLSSAPGEFFLCFAVPVILGILFVQSAIFVGGASWFSEEYDREWWGRAAGWVLIAALLWIFFTAIVIYGPVLMFQLPGAFTAIGGVSGLFAILAGRSSKTSASSDQKEEKATPTDTGTNILLALAAPLFVVAIAALLSLCTSEVLLAIRKPAVIDSGQLALANQTWRQIEQADTITQKGKTYQAKLRSGAIPAIDEAKYNALRHLWMLDHTHVNEGLILVFGFAFFGVFISFFLGVNQFSMHALYRNRLVRAYLGASRFSRTPNAFSGFDPNDNLPMHRLRPEMLWANSFIDIVALGALLKANSTLEPFISDPTWSAIDDVSAAKDPQEQQSLCLQAGDLLAHDLNGAIDTADLGNATDPGPLPVRNRMAIESLFPKHIRPMSAHVRPMHVINMTLNVTAGDNLAWQERKAMSFAATPINTGNWELGYRPTRLYGGPTGISLGTAVAISGAAASPNMGYHSSPPLSFLLTLFNVRLGWWLGNPRSSTYVNRNPTNSLVPFLAEAAGYTNDTFPYIYLSDGGHFENLGLYEMVLRRCACIVLTDCGADPTFGFDDLGNAIRKIRIDFGIDITIDRMGIFPRSDQDPNNPKYCAVATIHYERIDPGAKPGKLLYIKPAFYGEHESKDIYNYAQTNPTFPHQTTADQWFSESQFESYRQLGYWTLGYVTRNRSRFNNVCDLIDEAEQYLKGEGA